MATPMPAEPAKADTWATVPTQTLTAGGVDFAYRELGQQHGGTPVVLLVHLAAVLDNWDPRIVDGLAAKHHVIAFDNRGIGASSGSPSSSMEQMADDAITFIKAKGFQQVDLFGFSMGGMVAQEIVLKDPQLVRKMILTGTGPAGGEGISSVAGVTFYDILRGLFTGQDAKQFLFFTRTPGGIEAGKAFLERLKERAQNRDTENQRQRLPRPTRSPAHLGWETTGGPVGRQATRAGGQRRCRPHGADDEHPRPGTAPAQQHADHLPRRRPWRHLSVPRRLRAQGTRVPGAIEPIQRKNTS
jgi:pimeloyl-ACP methyl ester carboxylesterase